MDGISLILTFMVSSTFMVNFYYIYGWCYIYGWYNGFENLRGTHLSKIRREYPPPRFYLMATWDLFQMYRYNLTYNVNHDNNGSGNSKSLQISLPSTKQQREMTNDDGCFFSRLHLELNAGFTQQHQQQQHTLYSPFRNYS